MSKQKGKAQDAQRLKPGAWARGLELYIVDANGRAASVTLSDEGAFKLGQHMIMTALVERASRSMAQSAAREDALAAAEVCGEA